MNPAELLRGKILNISDDRREEVAKHTKRRGRRRAFSLRKVRVTPELNSSTLASDTALTVTMTGVADGAYRCMSIKSTWSARSTVGEGPVTVGYAHSDYTVAEIKESLEAAAAISTGDKIAQEQSNRLIRIVGTLPSVADPTLNDGKPISTKLNWLIAIGDSVNMFMFNEDTAPLTSLVLHQAGVMWVKDST